MDADNILQKYILIKPNTLSYNGQYDTALQSLENVPSINRCNISSDKMTNNYHLYHQQQAFGGKIDGKKPRPLVMSKRNARERRRVKMINLGYETLRLHVPGGAENKKLSKVDTLRRAVDYIKYLQTVLEMDSSSVEIKTEANCEEEDSSQSSEVFSSDFNNIPSRSESAKTPPSVDDNSENTENEVFIDIASWLLKSPNNFRSNIRLKDMGPNDQQLFSNLM